MGSFLGEGESEFVLVWLKFWLNSHRVHTVSNRLTSQLQSPLKTRCRNCIQIFRTMQYQESPFQEWQSKCFFLFFGSLLRCARINAERESSKRNLRMYYRPKHNQFDMHNNRSRILEMREHGGEKPSWKTEAQSEVMKAIEIRIVHWHLGVIISTFVFYVF